MNARPPLTRLGGALSSCSLGAGITCTRNLDIYFNCSGGFKGPGFLKLLVFEDPTLSV